MCEFLRLCKFYSHNIRKCIGYNFYCIYITYMYFKAMRGKTVTQYLLIASLYLPVCKIVSLYNSIASLKSTFFGTPLEFPL